jgi:hypothetical protein
VTTNSSAVSGYSYSRPEPRLSLVGTGKSQADSDDVRVLYWSAGSCGWAAPPCLDQTRAGVRQHRIWVSLRAGIGG